MHRPTSAQALRWRATLNEQMIMGEELAHLQVWMGCDVAVWTLSGYRAWSNAFDQ
jgi:hypothetical protein